MKSVRANDAACLANTATIQGAGAPRKVIARYPIATIGSRTRRGGEVVLASQGEPADDFRIACVGDRVRYPDGSESVIVSGAGHASTYANRPIALVGSHIATASSRARRASARSSSWKGNRFPACWSRVTRRQEPSGQAPDGRPVGVRGCTLSAAADAGGRGYPD